jgi:hypothetical protein
MSSNRKKAAVALVLVVVWIAASFSSGGRGVPTVVGAGLVSALLALVAALVALVWGIAWFVSIGKVMRTARAGYERAIATGDYEAANREAMSLPRWPPSYRWIGGLWRAQAASLAGRFDDAASILKRLPVRAPRFGRGRRELAAVILARRAVAWAVLDDDDAARAAADAARRLSSAIVVEGVATFAKLVVVARRRDRASMRVILDAPELGRGLSARETQIVRAIERFAESDESKPSTDDTGTPSSQLSIRADSLVPRLSRYLGAIRTRTVIAIETAPPSTSGGPFVPRGSAVPGRRPRSWVGLIVVGATALAGVAVWYAPRALQMAAGATSPVLVMVAAFAWLVFRSRHFETALSHVAELEARGRLDQAARLAGWRLWPDNDTNCARAHQLRARLALHAGDPERALARCDDALAHLARVVRGHSSRDVAAAIVVVHEEITATRAMALSALGRRAVAQAELGFLRLRGPAPFFCVELYRRAREGDVRGLVDLAGRVGMDLVLGPFEAALLDAAGAAADDAFAERRLRRTVTDAPAIAEFLERVAPRVDRSRGAAADR